MRKIKLQMQTTLDGFVAGRDGELNWMTLSTGDKDEKDVFGAESTDRINELIDSSDTILMGRKMTDGFIDYWSGVLENPDSPEYAFAKKMIETPKIVFSKTVKKPKWINTTVANGDLVEEIEKLKNQDGKDILVYGGADFAASLIKNNLIDEYHLFVNPVVIGEGLRIFGDVKGKLNLRLIKAEVFPSGEIEMFYEPQR